MNTDMMKARNTFFFFFGAACALPSCWKAPEARGPGVPAATGNATAQMSSATIIARVVFIA